jgi:hypothetical protein
MIPISTRWRTTQAIFILLFILGMLPSTTGWASTSGTVFATAPQVQTEIYDANVLTRYTGIKQTDRLLEMAYLTVLYQDHPQLPPQPRNGSF